MGYDLYARKGPVPAGISRFQQGYRDAYLSPEPTCFRGAAFAMVLQVLERQGALFEAGAQPETGGSPRGPQGEVAIEKFNFNDGQWVTGDETLFLAEKARMTLAALDAGQSVTLSMIDMNAYPDMPPGSPPPRVAIEIDLASPEGAELRALVARFERLCASASEFGFEVW
jgi:hypothetical protein